MVYNKKLNNNDIEFLKNYIDKKYNLNNKIVLKGLNIYQDVHTFQNNIWKDAIKGEKTQIHNGKLEKITDYKFGTDHIKIPFLYLKGNNNTRIETRIPLYNMNWTLVYVTRYEPYSKNLGRILSAFNSNYIGGHNDKNAGVFNQHNIWINNQIKDRQPNKYDWIFVIEQPNVVFVKGTCQNGKHIEQIILELFQILG